MLKNLFSFLLIFFLTVDLSARAQTIKDISDSLVKVETIDDSLDLPRLASFPMESLREVPVRQVRKYLKDPDFAYANDPEYWKKERAPKTGNPNQIFSSPLFRWIIFGLVITIVLFGIYQLAKENNFNWFTRERKKHDAGTSVQDLVEEMDFETAIRKYQDERNYRLAVRYMYLRLIHTAREKAGIQFRDSSTNSEIAHAFGSHPKAGEFRFLARAYEYVFYGDFIPGPELYNLLKTKFENFQQAISS